MIAWAQAIHSKVTWSHPCIIDLKRLLPSIPCGWKPRVRSTVNRRCCMRRGRGHSNFRHILAGQVTNRFVQLPCHFACKAPNTVSPLGPPLGPWVSHHRPSPCPAPASAAAWFRWKLALNLRSAKLKTIADTVSSRGVGVARDLFLAPLEGYLMNRPEGPSVTSPQDHQASFERSEPELVTQLTWPRHQEASW